MHKFVTPPKEGWRDLREGSNDRRRIRSLKGRDVRTMDDGNGITIVGGEAEKSRVIPLSDIRRGGVIIPIHVVGVPTKRGKNKYHGTSERHHRRGGGRIRRHGGGGRRRHRRGGGEGSVFKRIHSNDFFFFLSRR
jgi:hypothetical protein